MSLETKLAEIRDASGTVGNAVKVGDPLPPFALENQDGDVISSVALLNQGAVVLTVFRGHW